MRILCTIFFVVLFGWQNGIANPSEEPLEIIAYYSGGEHEIDQFDVNQLDQIIYSFLHLRGNKLVVEKDKQDATIRKLVSLKKVNPNLKIMISLGGWGGCETCSKVFSVGKNRLKFAKSVLKILKVYGADGIDLDWEYPGIEGHPGHPFAKEDKKNFTLLVKALRDALGSTYAISFAAGAHKAFLDHSVEWKQVMPLVDNVNLMTYDLVNGFSKATGHHTALYSNEKQLLSTDYSLNYLDSMGVPMNKIVIGAAFYGRVWNNVDSINSGLHQPGTFHSSVIYRDIEAFIAEGFVVQWDSVAQAPYAYHFKKKMFITYENKKSVAIKTKYAKQKGLKGMMFWELIHDTKNGLLPIIFDNK